MSGQLFQGKETFVASCFAHSENVEITMIDFRSMHVYDNYVGGMCQTDQLVGSRSKTKDKKIIENVQISTSKKHRDIQIGYHVIK